MVYQQLTWGTGYKHTDIYGDPQRLGYEHTSKGLICVGARGLGVSVHADAAVSFKPIACTPSIVKAAEELPILKTGTMVPYDDLEVYAARRLSGASVLVA